MNEPLAGKRLYAFPHYPNNPWQQILYGYAADRGLAIHPIPTIGEWYDTFAHETDLRDVIVHLNWTAPIVQPAPDILEATRSSQRFVQSLRRLAEGGAKILWTVHNELPHETRYRVPELHLARSIVEMAHRVIILNPATAALVERSYALPAEKLCVIEHPSYVGIYPDEVSRAAARSEFGYSDDEFVLLCAGVVRPYKNIARVVEAVREMPGERLRLVIAGELGQGTDEAELRRAVAADDRISLTIDFVPDDRLQYLFRSADLAVFAFDRILNSGSLMLSASFGTPALVSALPALGALPQTEEWIEPLEMPFTDDGFRQALGNARARIAVGGEIIRRAASAYARERSPERTGRAFFDLVVSVIGS